MDFKTAAFTCLKLKYANFTDRAPRSEYWWFMLLSWLSMVALIVLVLVLASVMNPTSGASLFHIIFVIAIILWVGAFFIPSIAVSVRRFHDIDMAGWWYLLFYILQSFPFIGIITTIVNIVLFCKPGTEGPNRFGNSSFAVDDYQKTFQ